MLLNNCDFQCNFAGGDVTVNAIWLISMADALIRETNQLICKQPVHVGVLKHVFTFRSAAYVYFKEPVIKLLCRLTKWKEKVLQDSYT